MNTLKRTLTVWITNELPNLQNNNDEIIWCKTIEDAKYTIQKYEIETIDCMIMEKINIFVKPIDKIIVEDSINYGEINLWISETNRQYLLNKVELISKEESSDNIKYNKYVNINDVYEALLNGWHTNDKDKEKYINEIIDKIITPTIVGLPEANVLELNNNYQVGDICIYGGGKGQSYALVQLEEIFEKYAVMKFIKVFHDNTGNEFFEYLLTSGNTMNGSYKYLKNITPKIN